MFTILFSLHLCVLCFKHPNTVSRGLLICTSGLMLFAVSPSSSVNSPYLLPVLVLPHLRAPTGLYFPRAIGTCGQQPSHKPAKYNPPIPRRQQVNPLWLSAPLFWLLSSWIKLQRREVRSSAMLGRTGGVCVSDRVNQANESAVSQPHPCSHVQDLHFRQALQSPDSDFQGKSLQVSSTRGTDAVVW